MDIGNKILSILMELEEHKKGITSVHTTQQVEAGLNIIALTSEIMGLYMLHCVNTVETKKQQDEDDFWESVE